MTTVLAIITACAVLGWGVVKAIEWFLEKDDQ